MPSTQHTTSEQDRGTSPAPPPQEDPRLEVSYGVRVAAWWSLCFVAICAALFVLVRLLNSISLVTITISVALMLAALLHPYVSMFRRIGLPHPLAAMLMFLLGIAGICVMLWFVVSQVTGSGAELRGQLQAAASTIRDWLTTGPLQLSGADVDRYTTELGSTLQENRAELTSGFMRTASSALGVISGVVFCLFATLFLLLDRGTIWQWVVRIFPPHARPHAEEAGGAAWSTLVRYMQSLVLLAVINAVAMVPVMLLAGLPLVVPLAVLLFLGSLVPLIGVLVSGTVVALIALVAEGPGTALIVVGALVLIVQLGGNLLNPVILGKAVNIHPLAILMAVTAGTILAGVFGAFVAVPLVAVLKNSAKAVREHHRGDPEGDGEPGGDRDSECDREPEPAAEAAG